MNPPVNIKEASEFIGWRVDLFRKDFDICLTPNANNSHAYMPALMSCLALLELFSGLLKGKVRDLGVQDIKRFRNAHMAALPAYSDLNAEVLHFGFRNKIAHLGTPHIVFDTAKHGGIPGPQKKITWTIHEGRGADVPALELLNTGVQQIQQTPMPWPVFYDHRMIVCLTNLRTDILGAIGRYAGALDTTPALLNNFFKAVEDFYSR